MQRDRIDDDHDLRYRGVSDLIKGKGWCRCRISRELTIPEKTPPDPSPAMALPMIKAMEFGAAPQMAEPASNSKIDVRKVPLMLKKPYSFPNTSWNAQLVSKYAVPYQPMSPAELNSSVI